MPPVKFENCSIRKTVILEIKRYFNTLDPDRLPSDDVLHYRPHVRSLNHQNLSNHQVGMVRDLTKGLYDASDPTDEQLLSSVLHTHDETTYDVDYLRIYELKDSEVLVKFPPRAKICVGMRRLRMLNICKTNKPISDQVLPFLHHLNYELVVNILLWTVIHGVELFMLLKKFGYFNSYDTFVNQAKELGYRVKVYERSFDLKTKYAELNNLVGHIMIDDDFDIVDESRLLAHGPEYHGIVRSMMFRPMLQELMGTSLIQPKTQVTFEEYVKKGLWLTSGSSSIGRVTWEYDDKLLHFKARKNMLVDLYSPDDLWELARDWDGVIRNKPIVKNELSKMRLAVASNIESYLYESYMMCVLGHEYTTWDYITLDESESAYCKRTTKLMSDLTSGYYALPWDFKSFDHQASTYEIQSILSNMFSKLIMTDEQNLVAGRILASYGKGIIYQDTGDSKFSFHISGGLQSGQRITSLIGNIWNAVVTKSAIWLAKHLCPDLNVIDVALRGDDTYIITDTALNAYYVRLAYASMFALGNDAKFSIRRVSCEFLRSEITRDHVTAWPNRSIPSMTQRKPWSDKPWDAVREVTVMADNIRTTERRLSRVLPTIHLANKQQWSKFTRQSYHYLHLPKRLGGLGVYDFEGWVTDCRLPPAKRPHITVKSRLHGDMPQYLDGLVSREDYLAGSLAGKMQPGDVAGYFVGMTKTYLDSVRNLRPQWELQKGLSQVKDRVIIRLKTKLNKILAVTPEFKFPQPRPKVNLSSITDGWPSFARFLSDYGKINDKIKLSLGKLTKIHYPDVWRSMSNYERRGFHRTDAISLILGEVPCEQNCHTNDRLTVFVKEAIKEEILQKTGRSQIGVSMANYTRIVAKEMATSTLNILFNF